MCHNSGPAHSRQCTKRLYRRLSSNGQRPPAQLFLQPVSRGRTLMFVARTPHGRVTHCVTDAYRYLSLSVACDTTLLRDTYACFVILGSGVDLIRRARHTQHTTVDTTEPTATGVFNLPTAHAPSSHVRYTSRTRFVKGSSRLHVSARTPVHAPRARGLICGRSPEARRHANYVRHVVPRGPVRVRYPTVPPNPPLTYPLPLIPVFELVAHEIDSDRTSRALRPP